MGQTKKLKKRTIFSLLGRVPTGKVVTYKNLAKAVGRPKSARAIGKILSKNKQAPKIPCHRVVRSDGKLGGYRWGIKNKTRLLRKEGIEIKRGKIDLKRFGFTF